MPHPIISVEHLSKAYRIGLAEEVPDTLVGAATSWLTAPLRNWRRLRRLDVSRESRVESREQEASGQLSAVSSQHNGGNGQQTKHNGQPTTDNCQLSTDTSGSQSSTLNPQPSPDIIWALKDVSFEVHQGEVIGIIGRNGAGKSTLLKILSRITEPTSGRAVIRGRVSSLLEVGTGFHPELTGRENIYMNGTILGMTKKEIDRKFDEIVDFSGVEQFLDTPIKRYSSGMNVRLAFAVAAHLEPEILIVDEVLAVGDAEFQKKCLGKMHDVAAGGRTVLFVSHNMAAVEGLCTRAAMIQHGRIVRSGDVDYVISSYMRSHAASQSSNGVGDGAKQREGNGAARIVDIRLLRSDGMETSSLRMGEGVIVELTIDVFAPVRRASITVAVWNSRMQRITALKTQETERSLPTWMPGERVCARCVVPALTLRADSYTIHAGIVDTGGRLLVDRIEDAAQFDISAADVFGTTYAPADGVVYFPNEWTFSTPSSPVPAGRL